MPLQVKCPHCAAAVPAADINLDHLLAKCSHCDAVFDISAQTGRAPSAESPPAGAPDRQRRRQRVPLPEGLTVTRGETDSAGDAGPYREPGAGPGTLTIARRWFSPKFIFLVFFCAVWDCFLLFWYFVASTEGAIMMMVFPLLHVAVGLGLTYFTVAGFLNTTTVTASSEGLSFRHAPLPWPGNRTIPARDLSQLYCQRHVSRGKNGTHESYSLNAVVRGSHKLKLLSGLSDPDQCLFIEQAVEEHLGIVDLEVGGEYRP